MDFMQAMDDGSQPRNVFIMRHGERIDFTFGSWVPYCFDEDGNYIHGAKAYLKDSPLTNIGIFEASMVGEALKEKDITIDAAYCSPSFRCIQTCDAVLRALDTSNISKIKIEPGLFRMARMVS
ncbi:hypothetical protein NQ317_012681 [Molorchus minor]|uniref:Phosphoglycerate mutase n=1 Tax=Molorchus minor TaxID=1323400 RepID=A0ABQ9IV21_9CUCU|nr:hypothetical protein NQ317_012681 [Molorchus minor]